ncbi:hypothetical protein [Alicycliphilus denitrificans]|uniref:Transporter n=1 Tax=Alicycliphilus denitrificans TaxID=179636 RepID=A0A3R7HS01_9BURK|nr:hypothetical protein [Alicycliphilus denitrificans]MBN9573671.1 hypothetical protein [Alicycliphilus denitrificans]OJW90374.1 MAG: hypothetical protein BGO66_05110 [Alicycliphilus sp. 69-12]RKJ99618.1 hypothetical protein CE154_007830 [Alicycliphilus denitrificans]
MHLDFITARRPAHIQRVAALAGGLAAALLAPHAHAARPMITDDARVVDAKACQLESWVNKNADSTEAWALPACNFTGNLELTLGGALTRQSGQTHATDVQAQGKTILKPLEANGWGMGLAVGTVRHAQAGNRDWYAYVPASFSFRDDAVVVHANIGWLREGETRRDRMTWGLGTETRLAGRTWLIAEIFGQGQEQPLYQLGLRYWLVPDRVQIDTTYGNRSNGGERWFSIGLRLLSVPFLP